MLECGVCCFLSWTVQRTLLQVCTFQKSACVHQVVHFLFEEINRNILIADN